MQGPPITPEQARILQDFGLGSADILGEGSESLVFALGDEHVLRLPKRRKSGAPSAARLKTFLDGIAGKLPFATPTIEEIGEGDAYTIAPRLPGRPMADFLRTAGDDARDRALRNYIAAIDAFATIEFPAAPYGQLLALDPVTADDWRSYAHESLDRFRAANRVAIAKDVGDPYELFDHAADMIAALPRHPPKALVHGDYFPGNVLLGPDLAVSAVVDFGRFTVTGDATLDLAVACLTLELMEECTADDARFARQLVIERHGDAIVPALRFYRAYLAFSMADPSNVAPPYPRLYGWSTAMLKLLGADKLPA
jgi:putative membrane protein